MAQVIRLKWFKKWSYLLLMITAGVLYLSVVDKWQFYGEPIAYAKDFYSDYISYEYYGRNEYALDEVSPETDEASTPVETPSGEIGQEQPTGEGTVPDNIVDGTEESPAESSSEEESWKPVFETVEDDYFSDAVFIGDSRTVGMFEYGELEEISTFYASTGLTVYKLFDADIVSVPGQKKKINVEEALQQNSFHKIYLMIGINEMGTGTVETFAAKYQEVVNHLLELQPDAILYVQAIMKVTTERSNQGDYITNEGIEARNVELAKLADDKRIFYLDVNPEICDETGGMVEDYTFDGVHLKAQYIEIWKDFLKANAVVGRTN